MVEVLERTKECEPLVVHTSPVLDMNDARFFEFCQINRDLRIERTAQGDLVIIAPAGGSSGHGNSELNYLFNAWARVAGGGKIFGSSTGFRLFSGAVRAPDLAWVRDEQLNTLTEDDWDHFLPLTPDFVLELRSRSDSLRVLQRKLEEYIQNGARLGWLLDPLNRRVHIYTPGPSSEVLDDPETISGEPVLRGFHLNVRQVWNAMRLK
jgi:Uma2 family endonuclease